MRWNEGRIPADFETTDTHLAEIYIVFAGSAAKRGRVYVRAKEELINKYIDKYFPDAKCRVDESFDYTLWNPIDLQELIFWCSRKLDHAQKLQLFEFLAWICNVDHEIVEEEKELLLYVLGRFQLSFDELSAVARATVEIRSERVRVTEKPLRSRYLSVLGLKETASAQEIKKTYRLLVKQVHPDRHPNATVEQKQLLEARFQEIQEAYDFLTSN